MNHELTVAPEWPLNEALSRPVLDLRHQITLKDSKLAQ